MSAKDVPSPFALGWARKLALANAPDDATVRELFDRQLLIGLAGASSVFPFVSSIPNLLMGMWQDLLLTFPFVAANALLLVVFAVRGQRVAPYAHALLALGYTAPAAAVLLFPSDLVWSALVWAFPYTILAVLLTGLRGGLAWTAILVFTFAAAWAGPAVGLPLDTGADVLALYNRSTIFVSYCLCGLFILLALGWFSQQRAIVERLLDDEHRRFQALLHNILPGDIAARLHRGEVIADALDEVTIVFADLVGFTTIAAGLPARRVVAMLAELFGEIDRIAADEGVEKLKTIGDCYMAVVGAPTHVPDHADRALRFALRVQAAMQGRTCFGQPLQLRIGVHSGAVMAGIIGETRLLYDLWGDTVNVASRLESTGLPGEVQVSETTLRLCLQRWHAEDRGLVQLKGRSGMRCFLLRGGPGDTAGESAQAG